VAPTVLRMLGLPLTAFDGVDLSPAFRGTPLSRRELYAESFAPAIEFGWAPLRAIRSGPWKLIAAPKPELFDVDKDAGEQTNLLAAQPVLARSLEERASHYAAAALPGTPAADAQAAERLRALGYSSGGPSASPIGGPQSALSDRPDPKDRRDLAARIAQVTSGELTGAALLSALEGIVREDPRNGQAHLRLGFARLQAGDCARAEPEFHAAAAAGCRQRTRISASPPASAGAAISPVPSMRLAKRGGSSQTARRFSRTWEFCKRPRATSPPRFSR